MKQQKKQEPPPSTHELLMAIYTDLIVLKSFASIVLNIINELDNDLYKLVHATASRQLNNLNN